MTTKIPAELSSTPGIADSSNATAITIDSSEQVGIGTTAPNDYDNNSAGISSNLVVKDSGHSGIIVISGTSSDAAISFGDGTGTDAYRGAVAYVNSADALYFKAAGLNKIRLDSDGLKFGSDTAAANALDDYEEGTWTPAISGGTSTGSTTHTSQDGYYIKVGSLVTASCFIRYTATTGSGYLKLTGLPYAVENLTQNYPTAPVLVDNLNWGGGTYIVALGVPSLSEVNFYYLADDAGSSRQNITDEIAAFRFTLTYRT